MFYIVDCTQPDLCQIIISVSANILERHWTYFSATSTCVQYFIQILLTNILLQFGVWYVVAQNMYWHFHASWTCTVVVWTFWQHSWRTLRFLYRLCQRIVVIFVKRFLLWLGSPEVVSNFCAWTHITNTVVRISPWNLSFKGIGFDWGL